MSGLPERIKYYFQKAESFTRRHRVAVVGTSSFLILTLIVQQAFFHNPKTAEAALTTIRQEINIIDGSFSAATSAYATSSEIANIDVSKYTGATYYFEVVASTTSATNGTVSFVNATSGATIRSITINGTAYARYRSTSFSLSSVRDYKVRLNNEAVGKGLIAARVVILQNNNPISATQTQIEVGNSQTYTSGTAATFTAPKYWKYTSSKWDGSPTFYAEVTYARTLDATKASSTTYRTSGSRSFTVPSSVASTTVVQLWGAGGAGGAGTVNTNGSGSGAAGGQFSRKVIASLAGLTKTVAVAATTTGGVGTGAAGADSTWDTNVVVAKGGAGGALDSGAAGTGSTASGVGDVVNAGGNGAAGVSAATSGGGGEGGRSTGTGGSASGGTGGTGGDGGDGGAGRATNGIGNPGFNPGGGGAGGRSTGNPNVNGGDGALGRAIISYNLNQSATTTITLQESDGTGDGFVGWADKITIVSGGSASTPTRVRSSSFTPTTGRNYRIAFKEGYNGATHAIYNAKIVVDQGIFTDQQQTSTTATANTVLGGTAGSGEITQAAGQSFTAGYSANLKSISLFGRKLGSPADNLSIIVRSGSMTGTVVGTSDSVSASSLSTSAATVSFTFSSAVSLTNGVTYYFSIERSGARDGTNYSDFQTSISNPYAGGAAYTKDNNTWSISSGTDLYFITYMENSFTKLEAQYLLAPKTLGSGTALQKYLTYWDSAEWTNSANTYTHQVDASNNSTSVVEVDTSGGTQVSGSVVTSPDNSGVSSSMTMPSTGDLDMKATTNNGDVYASRILVAVTPDTTAPTPNPYFTTAPNATTTNMVNMTSVVMTDANAVSYFFNPVAGSCGGNTGTGTTTSGWQASRTYTDVGLQVNKCYAYTVTGKDAAGNTTATSTASTTYTLAAVPGGMAYTNGFVTVTSIKITNTENGNPASNPTTNFAVHASSTGDSAWNNKWVSNSAGASSTAHWLSDSQLDNMVLSNLKPNTKYDFEVVARNQNSILTATSTRTGTTTRPDVTAPTPNPATFSSVPNDTATTQMSMTATAASDISTPISYYFAVGAGSCGGNYGTGGTDSGWQTSTSYTDTGLDINKCYAYTVQSRDSLSNTGTASAASQAYTTAAVPSAPTISTQTDTTFTLTNNQNGNPTNTTFAVHVATASPSDGTWNGKYVDASGNPSAAAVWLSDAQIDGLVVTGLQFSTTYPVEIMARNGDSEQTAYSSQTNGITTADSHAPTPNPPTFSSNPSNDSVSQISMTANAITDPSTPVSYYFAAVTGSCGANVGTGGTDSGWQTSTSYSDAGLQTNKCYGYTITGKDNVGNTSSASSATVTYTSAAVPGQLTQVSNTTNTITISNNANGNPSANPITYFAVYISATSPTDLTWDGKYVNGSGNPSAVAVWLTNSQLTNLVINGLQASTVYTAAVKARNEDTDETTYGSTQALTTGTAASYDNRLMGGIRLKGIKLF